MMSEVAGGDETSATAEAEATEETEVVAVSEGETEPATEEASENGAEDSEPKKKVERERYTMFIGNLSPEATSTELKELFEGFGKVELVSIPRDRETGVGRGFAFVDMSTMEELTAAVDGADGTNIGGREIRVSESQPKATGQAKPEDQPLPEGYKKLYFGNLPFAITVDEVRDFFKEFGDVTDVYLPTDRETGRGRGFAFVTIENEAADAAIEAKNGEMLEGRPLVVSEPLPQGQKAARRARQDTKIYIGNLSFYTVAETLEEIFEEFGEVHDCYLPADRDSGGTRGFGFVTMSRDSAQKAIDELDGCEIDGRIVKVNEAQQRNRF